MKEMAIVLGRLQRLANEQSYQNDDIKNKDNDDGEPNEESEVDEVVGPDEVRMLMLSTHICYSYSSNVGHPYES